LEDESREAICCADRQKMLDLGFNKKASDLLADTIIKRAGTMGIKSHTLRGMFEKIKTGGGSSIINRIVRETHKHWFTSRSNLPPLEMIDNLKTSPVDLTGWMFVRAEKSYVNT
jgi:hypothetical protein